MKYLLFLIALSSIFCSCSQTTQDCICTMEFRTITTAIVDNYGSPIDSVLVIVTNKQSGNIYDFGSNAQDYYGNYTVMTDLYTKDFSTTPTIILFEASKGNTKISAEYQITTDACKCHISKTSGPDTLTLNIKQLSVLHK